MRKIGNHEENTGVTLKKPALLQCQKNNNAVFLFFILGIWKQGVATDCGEGKTGYSVAPPERERALYVSNAKLVVNA